MFRGAGRASTRRTSSSRRGLGDTVVIRQYFDPVLVLVFCAFAFNSVYIQIGIERHGFLLRLRIIRPRTIRATKSNAARPKLLAASQLTSLAYPLGWGSRATSRKEMVSSSSWKCGRKKATAL